MIIGTLKQFWQDKLHIAFVTCELNGCKSYNRGRENSECGVLPSLSCRNSSQSITDLRCTELLTILEVLCVSGCVSVLQNKNKTAICACIVYFSKFVNQIKCSELKWKCSYRITLRSPTTIPIPTSISHHHKCIYISVISQMTHKETNAARSLNIPDVIIHSGGETLILLSRACGTEKCSLSTSKVWIPNQYRTVLKNLNHLQQTEQWDISNKTNAGLIQIARISICSRNICRFNEIWCNLVSV